MAHLPVVLNLKDRWILIVGGGRVGSQKYRSLQKWTNRIRVIAPETELEGPYIVKRAFQTEDLQGVGWAILATGDAKHNARIAGLCRERNIPVDVVSDSAQSDFFLPASIKRGDLWITVSTGGASPAYSKQLRTEIEEMLPDDIESVLAQMKEIREKYRSRILAQEQRACFYRKVLSHLLASQPPYSAADIAAIAEEFI